MKKSRYLLKETKFAVFAGILSLILGIILLSTSVFLISFNIWTDKLYIDKSLLPVANNLPTFYDIDGNAIEYKSDNYLHPNEIPDNLKYAFIALEDKRFYDHNGFDTYRIAGAMAKNIAKGGAVEGASTITQQLIKNTHLTFEKTISRKLKEIALAQKLEQMYTKDEILSMYLSVIYFGNGAYGVKTASKAYFGKDVAELTLGECATLAGIIKSPTKYSPKNNIENALHRRNIVLNAMYEQGYITAEGVDEFVSAGIKQDNKIREIIERTGSSRNVSGKDREFYRTWTSVWGFGDDVILYAAELAVGKPYPMTYMNQLLSSWKNGDAMTLEKAKSMGVKIADNKGTTHKENYIERQYTDDEIQSIFGDIENFENLDI